MTESDRVAVGRILGAWGIRGEVKIGYFARSPDRFAPGSTLYLEGTPLKVERSRTQNGYVVAKFAGVADRDSAVRMSGSELSVDAGSLPPPRQGSYYHYQLIGLTAVNRQEMRVGTVSRILETGANDVYVIDGADGSQILLPAISGVVLDVDLARGLIVVDPPQGL